ncbi:Alpha/beta hydrolase family [Spongiibacter sp. IMCC21906]|uniref:alpha/beta fold hydrolase n=1 Tax=Spongiibacter sp. IMCC21906 TaxID=1620392 RepID=UPI00062DD055|nr:alpha/beta fold hydrolase [Spongiibacter sp. IMCC21906]AKH69305.1 Alpha/beta hydrolase family [Spongiibacter sp. IMCC21906]
MRALPKRIFASVLASTMIGCGGGSSGGSGGGVDNAVSVTPTTPENLDTSCDEATFPSLALTNCEVGNYARTLEATTEQLDVAFGVRVAEQMVTNLANFTQRALDDPSWLSPLSGNTPVTPVCASWDLHCVGDPFRYPEADGPDGAGFYENEAHVQPVVFYDRDCARLSGRVWMPRNADEGRLPAVVITPGSFQATETAYWWLAQRLVRGGYMVMTFDARGQGMSDFQTPSFQQGSNLNGKVFWEGQVDAIDFILSSPEQPYIHDQNCADSYPTISNNHNPFYENLDPNRLGIAGHSLGAIGVSVVQGYGGEGAAPWPGTQTTENPVKVAVALDSLVTPDVEGFAPASNLGLSNELTQIVIDAGIQAEAPAFNANVPALSFAADYAVAPITYLTPPDPQGHKQVFDVWTAADQAIYVISFQGTTHFDFSLFLAAPATSWCADTSTGACRGSWGREAIEYYSLAWFDRWLKQAGEAGYDDADARLVDDAGEHGATKMSFYFESARNFVDRGGKRQRCDNIRAGCL